MLPYAPCDPLPTMLADFARAAAERYSGTFEDLPRVKYWQVQNEPNLRLFFNPQFNGKGQKVSPTIYRRILNKTYPAIKSGHPGQRCDRGGSGAEPHGERLGSARFHASALLPRQAKSAETAGRRLCRRREA